MAMKHFLFVHFRETTSPEGEQVYFALSRDGFAWEALNEGRPILWAYYGDHGVRDMTIVRDRVGGKIHIFATDLSLSYGMRGKYRHSWENICRHGSRDLAHWESEDLVHWTEEEMIPIGTENFGCVWAPDILYDATAGDYLLHWSSATADNDFGPMGIYCSRTRDFRSFSEPKLLYRRDDGSVIDSAMYEENGRYYLFVKSQANPERVVLLVSDHPTGPFSRAEGFDRTMDFPGAGQFEAPTAIRLEDGRWCLFIDFYGTAGAGQGYRPFLADSLESGEFRSADECFSFPYRFKHGTVLEITEEEYDRMKRFDWSNVPDGRF
jgi:hypothetical protein